MSVCESSRAMRGAKPLGLAATILIVCGLVLAAPAVADRNQCAPAGVDSATALPADMTETDGVGEEDHYTTPTVEPLSSVNIG
jgi:polar amino acid transport system substrate-binding protein